MNLTRRQLIALTAMIILLVGAGCSDRDPASLPAARGSIEPLVFADDYHPDVYFQAFAETHVTAVSLDSVYAFNGQAADGARSLKFNVAPLGSALGLYTGGVLTSGSGRDLADFNALTFYARATYPISLDVAGLGNDNTGDSLYEAGRNGISLTDEWTFVVIPIPNSAKLLSERGMFTFAESLEEDYPQGYDIWVDEMRYATLSNIVVFRPTMASTSKPAFVGSAINIDGTSTVFQVDGAFVPVAHSAGYFDFETSDAAVAVVDGSVVRVIGTGPATITATLGEDPVLGSITVTGHQPPTTSAAAPTLSAAEVISLFSGAYDDVLVDTWRADWGGVTTQVADYVVNDNTTKMYSSLNWVGIEFLTRTIDASQMTHLHMDVYAPAGTDFKVKLVAFPSPPNGAQTTDLVLDAASTPEFTAGGWVSLDIPLADFQLPATGWDWTALGQLVLSSGDSQLVLVDNIYFHQ